MTKSLVFLLEEPSAKDMLEGLMPRLIPENVNVTYMVFEGKQDLEKRMERRMRGWRQQDARFVVLRDQDSGDCHAIKAHLRTLAKSAGKPTALIRIACKELEAWMLGDLAAVSEALNEPSLAAHDRKAKFRDPDALASPARELRSLVPTYQKRDGARRVGPRLDPSRNRSKSFQVFCSGVRRLAEETRR